jgi:hypothetical protein
MSFSAVSLIRLAGEGTSLVRAAISSIALIAKWRATASESTSLH